MDERERFLAPSRSFESASSQSCKFAISSRRPAVWLEVLADVFGAVGVVGGSRWSAEDRAELERIVRAGEL
jgi:hypothetical protein